MPAQPWPGLPARIPASARASQAGASGHLGRERGSGGSYASQPRLSGFAPLPAVPGAGIAAGLFPSVRGACLQPPAPVLPVRDPVPPGRRTGTAAFGALQRSPARRPSSHPVSGIISAAASPSPLLPARGEPAAPGCEGLSTAGGASTAPRAKPAPVVQGLCTGPSSWIRASGIWRPERHASRGHRECWEVIWLCRERRQTHQMSASLGLLMCSQFYFLTEHDTAV